eukprot:CAMPEP_0174701982 /NCGR_PEP_ID=MMETSP1094-20130205/6426_1 /TAXON_ID=156173 /ORGANISM="Chrysochromulina brevifilum, Strain UTEX LB 985" /LENGTH=446 /DNA_ID=CAMNT_0015899697 /DNA_START=212 /DNA_END=1550 /DNA_ORIENTATION=+
MVASIAALSLRYSGVALNIGADVGLDSAMPNLCDATIPNSTSCNDISYDLCNSESCQGYWAVYRISFATASFFFVMMLATMSPTQGSMIAHRGWWILKMLFIGAVMGGILFAPNNVLAYYAWIARFIAPIFLLYQANCYVDFGWWISEAWVEKDNEKEAFFCGIPNEGMKWKGFMLILSVGLLTGSITVLGLLYHYFPSGCAFNVLACTTTLIFGLINLAVQVFLTTHGNIFVSGLVFFYTTYLCYASVSAMPVSECNPTIGEDSLVWLVLSCVIAGLTVGYFSFRMGGRQMKGHMATSKAAASVKGDGADEVKVKVEGEKGEKVEEEEIIEAPEECFNYVFRFHFIMFIVAVYFAMMLTDWGTPAAAQNQKYNLGFASAWLQMVTNWAVSFSTSGRSSARSAAPPGSRNMSDHVTGSDLVTCSDHVASGGHVACTVPQDAQPRGW